MKPNEVNSHRLNFRFINLFFEKGAIQGLPYVGKDRLTLFERVMWLILTFCAVYFSMQLALESLDRFRTKSTVISIERDYYYWNNTLPSATICPMNRLSRNKFDAYCRVQNITGKDKDEFFDFLESLANSTYFNFNNIIDHPSIDKHNIDPKDYIYLIYNLTDDYTRNPNAGEYLSAKQNTDLVKSLQILTEWGICYAVNNFNIDDLTTSNLIFGKSANTNTTYDLKIRQNTVSQNCFDGEAVVPFMGIQGSTTIFIHGAYEVMKVEKRRPINFEALDCILQTFDITATNDFEKSTTLEQRQCRFPHESNLTYYPIYTRNLCQQECRINLAYKLCKCIPHFYPNHDAKKPVCHYKVLKDCIFKYSDVFENLNKINELSLDMDAIQCYCLPNCISSEIVEETCRSMTETENLITGNGIFISVKKYPLIRYRRQIIFTLTDLLVSIGGTAGFFLGSSVLSAVEVMYYFTFRLIWHCFGYKE